MSLVLQAPYELIQTTILLPSPELGDYTSPQVKTSIRNSENGVIYSTVKSNLGIKFEWDFRLTHAKARELRLFLDNYNSKFWRVTTWEDEMYKMKLLTNPVDFSPISLTTTITRLEFEGIRIA